MSVTTAENILIETEGAVGIIRLNRPKALNALNYDLMCELVAAIEKFERDDSINCIVLAGNEKVFAAGADITEMLDATVPRLMVENRFDGWDTVHNATKPIVAGVSGFCLGGGCELVMACDVVVASESAKFGQPEINLGIIPGAGGTQRLTRAVGKALAMDMILTGRMITADEALAAGLVSRVASTEGWWNEVMAVANAISSKSSLALRAAKECVKAAHTTTLDAGVSFERNAFYMLFATEDQKEGMSAFVEKRTPAFTGR